MAAYSIIIIIRNATIDVSSHELTIPVIQDTLCLQNLDMVPVTDNYKAGKLSRANPLNLGGFKEYHPVVSLIT